MFKKIRRVFGADQHPTTSSMADLANNMPVVSSSPISPSSPKACQLNQLTDAPTSPNGTEDLSFVLPDSDDCTSLQDLIDSELALRISADVPEDDTESEEPIPFSGRKQDVQYGNYDLSLDDPHSEERDIVPPVVNGKKEVDHGDEVEDFPEDEALVPVSNGVEETVSPKDINKIMELNSPDSDVSDGVVDINTKFILNEQGHGAGDLTEADILFFNTFNQVQSNGDEFLSSPEVENPPVQSPIVDDIPILTGFDPFATIPAQDLESPIFEAPKPFPSDDQNASSPDESREDVSPPSCVEDNFFVTNDKDVVVGNNEVVDNHSPTNNVDSPLDINNSMDVNNADNDLICIEGPEICSENGEMLAESTELVQEIEENGPGAMDTLISVEDTNLLTPESINIPVIGVTPPEEGTEYDEDAYYAQLESQPPIETEDLSVEEEKSKASPVEEPRDDMDSWIKVDDIDFDQSEGTEIEVIELNQSQVEDMAAYQSQASDIVEPIEHVFADQPAVCINKPDSDSESSEAVTSSSSTDKKSKKKKSGDGGDTKTKRNKKNKEGKENISVNGVNGVSPTNLATSPATPNEILLEDAQDLSNVSVKELRRSFGDLTNLVDKEEVQNVADMSDDGGGDDECFRPESPPVFSPVNKVSPSCSTLAQAGDENRMTPPILSPITVVTISKGSEHVSNIGWKARSLSDLRMSVAESMANRPSSFDEERPPIHTGVSVKALAASYCSLVNVDIPTFVRPSLPFSPEHRTKRVVTNRSNTSPAWLDNSKKSSFSKFDALQKKTVLHVRSVDASKVQKQFNQSAPTEVSSNCKVCSKQVFQMEQVKAERSVYHKNCFRCLQCSKQLTVDTYSSHEGQVYCKPHFKELFQPKVVIEDDSEPVRRRKPEMIIRENQPMELPSHIVRASDKPDLGLEELGSLNVKSRFQVFEKTDDSENTIDKSPSAVNVKRSPSILSKLARFQAKGMDVGVTDDSLNGIPLEESSSSEEEEEEEEGGDGKEVVRANRKQRERPVSFGKMEDIKGRWESGTAVSKEERRQERKQEIQSIRSRLFMGHQGKMKEMYQQAVSESSNMTTGKKDDTDVCSERAKSIKERFERGEPLNADDEDVQGKKPMDEDLVDAGYSKKSRSLFLELDATAAKQVPISPPKSTISRNESFKKPPHDVIFNRTPSQDVVKASDQVEDVVVETADIGNKFKFFETYKPSEKEKKRFRITPPREGTVKEKTPEREIYRDPTIVRSDDRAEESEITRSQTASKMLSFFKHMEESANKEEIPQGPKPLKRFTPPPDSEMNREDESSEDEESSEEEEEEDEDEHDPNIIRSSDKQEDEFLKQAATAARAKALRAKFERWEEKEIEREKEAAKLNGSAIEQGDDQTSIDSTRSLRARFESMNNDQSPVKDKQARPKVNRFV